MRRIDELEVEMQNLRQIPPIFFNSNIINNFQVSVTDIFAGNETLGAINSLGQIFTWGRNKYGQLGHRGALSLPFPRQLILSSCLEPPIVTLGQNHSFILQ